MTAIVFRDAKATWPTAVAGVGGRACDLAQRAMACVAATIMVCAVGVALLQLVVQILGFPAPIAVTAITFMAAALLNALRRHLRARARRRSGLGHPHSLR